MAAEPPIGESQTALVLVRQMRSLLAGEGWPGLRNHLMQQRDTLATRILEDDSLSHEERDKLRAQYLVYRELVDWPQQALDAQLSVLERVRSDDGVDLPES